MQIFLCQEQKVNRPDYTYKYIYLYDPIAAKVWIINPWTGEQRINDSTVVVDLYYKDTVRTRIHKYLIEYEE
jgi:hypothetical protein